MIVRVWKSDFDPAGKDRLTAYANQYSLPMLAGAEGNQGVVFYADADSWVTVTYWRDEGSIDKLEANPDYRDLVTAILDLGVLGNKQETHLYQHIGSQPALC